MKNTKIFEIKRNNLESDIDFKMTDFRAADNESDIAFNITDSKVIVPQNKNARVAAKKKSKVQKYQKQKRI